VVQRRTFVRWTGGPDVNILLYGVVVLVWGTTWIAIRQQVDTVPVEVSICYRAAGAGLLLFAYLLFRRAKLRFGLRAHIDMVLIGATLFSGNYLFLYRAEQRIPSGLVAVIFSMVLPFNMLNQSIFLRRKLDPAVIVAAVLGMVGITLVFWRDITGTGHGSQALIGAALALGSAAIFSLGNLFSARAQLAGVPVVESEAFGMAYGAILLVPLVLASGGFQYDPSLRYTVSLGYLVVFGSVLGFAFYLTILGRIGTARAGYITVFFPIVALVWSTLLEDYRWSATAAIGAALILVGSALTLTPPSRFAGLLPRSASSRRPPGGPAPPAGSPIRDPVDRQPPSEVSSGI
jgi:drug/metabolite transporter (DMT)-like permease